MPLTQEIARTEQTKDTIHNAMLNTDNKLVSLGGQKAVTMDKIPEKITGFTNKISKRASGGGFKVDNLKNWDGIVNMNLDFEPEHVIFFMARFGSNEYTHLVNPTLDSKINLGENNALRDNSSRKIWFESISKEKFVIKSNTSEALGKVEWLAFG